MMTERIDGWSVTVSVNAEDVLTIGNDHMGGSGSIGEFAPIMRTCAAHLLSFIGEGSDYAGNHVALAHATGDHSRDSVELEALRELRRTVEYQIAHGNGTLAIEAALERVQALKSQQRGNHAVRDATIEECSAICQRHASTTLSDPAMHAASRTAAHPVLVRAAVEIVGLKLERK